MTVFYTAARRGLRMGVVMILALVFMLGFIGFMFLPLFAVELFMPVGRWTYSAATIGNLLWIAVVVMPALSVALEFVRNRVQEDNVDDHYPVGAR